MEAWFARAADRALSTAHAAMDMLSPVGQAFRAFGGIDLSDPLGAEIGAEQRVLAAAGLGLGAGGFSDDMARGIAKTIQRAQGAEVNFDRVGRFLRARWEVPGDKGAGYVRWNRILREDGHTARLYKDVFNQGGAFERRDWYIR